MRARVPHLAPSSLFLLALGMLASSPAARAVCPADLVCVPVDTQLLCEGDVIATDPLQGRIGRVHRPCDDSGDGNTLVGAGGNPRGITVDSRGYVYWSDSLTNQILRFNVETSGGFIPDVLTPDLLAANPFARLQELQLTPDGTQMLAADTFANPPVIWEVDPINGELGVGVFESDVIGPFRPGIPNGMAFDPYDQNILYIADNSFLAGGVYRVDLSDGLREPEPLTDIVGRTLRDGPGGTLVPDLIQSPFDVEVFDPTPNDNTPPDHVLLVSNEAYPNCCGFDPASRSKVFVIPTPWIVPDPATDDTEAYELIVSPDVSRPLGLALADEDGSEDGVADVLYVAAPDTDDVKRFPISTVGSEVVAGTPDSFGGFDLPWNLHVVEKIPHLAAEAGGVAPPFRQDIVVLDGSASLSGSRLLRLTPDPNDFVGTPSTNNFGTVDQTEIVIDDVEVGPGDFETALQGPEDLCVEQLINDTFLYTATSFRNFSSPDLVEIFDDMPPDPAAAILAGLAPGELTNPSQILLTDEGHYLVLDRDTDTQSGKIVEVDENGTVVGNYIESSASDLLYEPVAMAFDPDGILVVANAFVTNDPNVPFPAGPVEPLLRILPPDPPGGLIDGERVFRLPVIESFPWGKVEGMVIDDNGDALVLDRENLTFGLGTGAAGVVRVDSGTGEARFKNYTTSAFLNPSGIAIDELREILVTDEGGSGITGAVFRIDPVGGLSAELIDFETLDPPTEDERFTFLDLEAPAGVEVVADGRAKPLDDLDVDGFGPLTDNCDPGNPVHDCVGRGCHNPDQRDSNGNGIGDLCEVADPDDDGWREIVDCDPSLQDCGPDEDNCPVYAGSANPNGFCPDEDKPLLCAACGPAGCANNDQSDVNFDGLGDVCQKFDDDDDGIPDVPDDDGDPSTPDLPKCANGQRIGCYDSCAPGESPDICTGLACGDPDQGDQDGDGIGDACEDSDGDGIRDLDDNCPTIDNPLQENLDSKQALGDLLGDDIGDVCDPDDDNDGVLEGADAVPPEPADNCDPNDPSHDCVGLECTNASQSNVNAPDDEFGDVCQPNDEDGDGWPESDAVRIDNCIFGAPEVICATLEDCFNPGQENTIFPMTPTGDVCEDFDGDGVQDIADNCPADPNPDQSNLNSDDYGDACQENDADGDFIPEVVGESLGPCTGGNINANCTDNCPGTDASTANSDQADADGDGIGDLCDGDRDGDGVPDASDNCPDDANPGQEDTEDPIGDGFGNRCDMDLTGDNAVGVPDLVAFVPLFGTDVSGTPDEEADADGDGLVGVSDFVAFSQRFGLCAGATEPTSDPCPLTAP